LKRAVYHEVPGHLEQSTTPSRVSSFCFLCEISAASSLRWAFRGQDSPPRRRERRGGAENLK